MSEQFVDARGLSCPEPVLMVQKALAAVGSAPLKVAVSSPTARDNVTALLEGSGRSPKTEDKDGEYWINA